MRTAHVILSEATPRAEQVEGPQAKLSGMTVAADQAVLMQRLRSFGSAPLRSG